MKKVAILEHVASEKAGTIRDFLVKERIPFEEIRLFERGWRLPEPKELSALVVLGGPMNVYEEDKHPFLKDEDRYIREVLRAHVPYLGICLGSQLLAKALGARVMKAARPEVGWGEVALSSSALESSLFKGFRIGALKVLQWHADTFELPQGAALLASNHAVPHQAFSHDDFAFGLQFHLEVDRPLLEAWFKNHADKPEILKEYDAYRPALAAVSERLYRNFFKPNSVTSSFSIAKQA